MSVNYVHRPKELEGLQNQSFGQNRSVPTNLVHEHEDFVQKRLLQTDSLCMNNQGCNREVYKMMWLWIEPSHMINRGHNMIGKHYGCY